MPVVLAYTQGRAARFVDEPGDVPLGGRGGLVGTARTAVATRRRPKDMAALPRLELAAATVGRGALPVAISTPSE
jgi:hypothetical protein